MKNILRSVFSMLLFLAAIGSNAQVPSYVYYVPLPEQQIHNAFTVLYGGTGTTYHTVVSIVPSESNIVIFYDQWEDGYEPTVGVKTQASTQIWGDNNPANGIPPGYTQDILVAGKPIVLENDITLPRDASVLKYDGRDKFASTQSLSASRSSWALDPGTVLADATEFYNSRTFGTFFYMPIGQNVPSDNSFSLVSLCVQASQNATQILIDKDGNGTTDVTAVINEGESYQVNGGIMSGGTVTSSKPVQVSLITGKIGGTYASRWYSLLPFVGWDKSYYSPVGTQTNDARSDVFLFNPQSSPLTVFYQVNTGPGSFSIPSKGVYRFFMPLNSSAHFHAALPFYAIGATDMDPANNLTWDWGYTLIPEMYLTNSIYCGWGVGCGGSPILYNGNPVWVSSTEDVDNVTVYVDLDGNPATGPLTDINGDKYDFSRVITPFNYTTIYDASDKDQTGMHVYTLDGRNIAAAWGEDPLTAGPGNPFLDVGNTIPPDPSFKIKKGYRFVYDQGSNHLADVGDTLMYVLYINNYTLQPYTDIYVYDTLPSQVTYKANSTYYDLIPLPDQTSPNTPFPLDQNGYYISLLPSGARDSIYFKCVVNGPITSGFIMNRTTALDNNGSVYRSNVKVPLDYNPTACTINFTNAAGTNVMSYNENETIYIKVTDNDNNQNPLAIDSVKVTVTSSSGDSELRYLLETGINTGVFTRSLPSSKIMGVGNNNGILNVAAGNTIAVTYTDVIFGGTCTITNFPITGPSFRKPLYLSDSLSATGMDRIKPWDGTPATTSTIGGTVVSTIAAASTSSSTSTSGTSLSFSHTPGNGSNRLLLVAVSLGAGNGGTAGTVSSVTFNGTAMQLVGTQNTSGNGGGVTIYLYRQINPVAGPANVVINYSGGTGTPAANTIVAGATTFTGVDQTTPVANFTSAAGGSGSPESVTITASAGDLAYSFFGVDAGTVVNNIVSTTAGGTELWNRGILYVSGAAGTKAGSPTVAMSYTQSDNQEWAICGLAIKPATVANPTTLTFTQNPTMCSNLTLPTGGAVKVKLWLTGITGSMPSNPNITAVLKNNGTSFLTLTNPTFTDNAGTANDTLVFIGTVSGTQTIATGTAVSMDVTTAQAGVSFQISYDATAMASMLRLPASNVIDISSFTVYNAANPGGIALLSAYNGQTVYIRATVTDPFGSNDIHDVTLRITDPIAGNTDVAMTQVATSGCTKTYEYAWVTGVNQGNYTLRAIASEGYENEVKDTAETNFILQYLDTGTPCSVYFSDNTYLNSIHSYPNANGTLYFVVQDLDQNKNPLIAETVHIIVTSSSGDQENVTLTESGVNTGIFRGSIPYVVSGAVTQGNGTMTALAGATLNFTYTDPDTPSDICYDNAYIAAGVAALSDTKVRLLPVGLYTVVGDTVRFQITVTNSGTTNHTNIALTDTYNSTCLTYFNAFPAPSSQVAGTITWNTAALGGTLNAGQSVILTVTFIAASGCGATINTATATATGVPNAVATSPVTIDNPQLSIAKTRTSPLGVPVYVGNTVTFSIVVTNTGNTTATTVPLVDTYSEYNLSFVSASPAPTSGGGGQINWANIGPITPGNNATINLTFTALHGNEGLYVINNGSVDFGIDNHGNSIPSALDSARLIIHSLPVANNDTNSTLVNTPVTGTVMANDYDDDGVVITVTPNSGTAGGIGGNFTINSAGVYTYTPPANTTGVATFTYQLCDPTGACTTAIVTITVLACLDPPQRPDNVH